MKKLILLIAASVLTAGMASAQRNLIIKDMTTGLSVFSGKDIEAGIEISCPGNVKLTFESTHDKVVDVFNTELKGEEMYYYLRFKTGKKFRGRELTIRAEGFNPITISAELEPKELRMYQLRDPDAEFVYGCYYEYRKRGHASFQKGLYNEARDNYIIAKQASDRPADCTLDEILTDIDSITVYLRRADEAVDLLDYDSAIRHYTDVLALNPGDNTVRTLRNDYLIRHRTETKKYYDMAEVYKINGDYEKALTLYERVVDSKYFNSYAQSAGDEAKRMRIQIEKRRQRSKVFMYEYSKQAPVAFSYGTYKNLKTGNYFNFSFHADALMLLSGKSTEYTNAELNFTPLGWTVNIIPPFPHFWLTFGLGYTGAAKYVGSDTEGTESTEGTDAALKLTHAVSPEAGMLIKVWKLAVRYTYQYRYSILTKDPIHPTRHVLGVGIAF